MDDLTRTIYLIRQTQLATYQRLEEEFRSLGVTPAQYTVLSICSRRGDRLSSADLSRRIGISPQSVNELITALEQKQLVLREEAQENRRILRIKVTAGGLTLLAKCDRAVDRIEGELFQDLSGKELSALRGALVKILGSVRTKALAES